eukprot:TRINITY_DN3003_c0_g1_i2.p1 TRINITY_DN3003_c0_g1~~TRINITY_DN3003_c0_g1_i2.p1  ORF type:complete len:730 (-),score=180.51 TRINITY_DN3003_c0_g1_i2:15-1958(-)
MFHRVPGTDRYYMIGRTDDLFIHTSGEKTDALFVEGLIKSYCPIIFSCALIGNGRFCNSLLVELNHECRANMTSDDILSSIRKAVDETNRQIPQHSRIDHDLIHILSADELLPKSDKGSVMRKKVDKEFQVVIDDMYKRFLGEADPIPEINQNEAATHDEKFFTNLLEEKIKEIMDVKVVKWDDKIFQYGMDSLQILRLTNQLRKSFSLAHLPANFLYSFDNLRHLKEYLMKIDNHAKLDPKEILREGAEKERQLANQLVKKYSSDLTDHSSSQNYQDPEELVVILTGATGSLGCFLLRDLLMETSVKKIYVPIRSTESDQIKLRQKLEASFESRKLEKGLLQSPKINLITWDKMIEGIKSNEEWKSEVTDVIHSAWRVDWTLPLGYFESQIMLVQSFCRFCSLVRKKRFTFISTIAAVLSSPDQCVKEEMFSDSKISSPNGYGLSKHVSERICESYSRNDGFPINILRLGQIAGDTQSGVWNTSEHIPLIIKGAQSLGVMPNDYMPINFIPVDLLSKCVLEFTFAEKTINDNLSVGHFQNPKVESWPYFLSLLSECGLDFETISYSDWVAKISNLANNISDSLNPLIKLAGYFQMMHDLGETEISQKTFDMSRSIQYCPTLQKCKKIQKREIKQYLDYWKEMGLLL